MMKEEYMNKMSIYHFTNSIFLHHSMYGFVAYVLWSVFAKPLSIKKAIKNNPIQELAASLARQAEL
jgi:hypothetical protein